MCLTHPGVHGEEEGEAEKGVGSYKGLSEPGFLSLQCSSPTPVVLQIKGTMDRVGLRVSAFQEKKKLLKGLGLSRQNLGDKKLTSCFVDPSFFLFLCSICVLSFSRTGFDGWLLWQNYHVPGHLMALGPLCLFLFRVSWASLCSGWWRANLL